MALYYGKHKVKDYTEWRTLFDEDQGRLGTIGVQLVKVMRSADDPNEVHFIFDIPDFGAFLHMMQTPQSKGLLLRAGVLEQPVIYRLQAYVPLDAISS
jgi:hypothetical protein